MAQYSVYPEGIDSSSQLPIVTDLVTPVKAEIVNRHRDAIIAIESELGIEPSGTYTTVRARLDALDGILAEIIAGGGGISLILKDGVPVLTNVTSINFIGSALTVTQDSVIGRVNVTISSTSEKQETITITSPGQTIFNLTETPNDVTTVEMFVNGNKQQYGVEYSVTNTTVTYAGPLTLQTTDVAEFWYISSSGSGGGGNFTAGGDLSGTSVNQTVIGLQGRSIDSTAPVDDFVLAWSASSNKWVPSPRTGITVNSLSVSPSLVEVSQTVITPSFIASYSVTPTTATLTDNAGSSPKNITSTPTSFTSDGTFTKNSFGGSVIFTDTATYVATAGNRSVTLSWGQRNYWGVGTAGQTGGAFIISLATSQVSTSRNASVSVNAGASQKIYYATRTAYGLPVFKDHATGFAVAITKSGDYSVTNSFGFVESYQLWESDNVGLGVIIMDVT